MKNTPLCDFISTKKSLSRAEITIKNQFPIEYNLVYNINANIPFIEKVYWYINDLTENPKCSCGRPLTYLSLKDGYRNHCSVSCAYKYGDANEKYKNTCIEKYGVDNPFKSKIIQNKNKIIIKELYGVENASQSENIQQKKRDTWIKKYGVDNPNKSLIIRTKSKQTCLEKYGTINPNSSEITKQKKRDTCFKRFGFETNLQCPNTKEKIKRTCINRYGVENPSQSKELKIKSIKSNLKRRYQEISHFDKITPLFSEEEYTGREGYKKYKWHCDKCDNDFYSDLYTNNTPICTHCFPRRRTTQKEIFEFVQKYIPAIQNCRSVLKNNEIDIFIPEKNIGIEFNGNYWHCEKNIPDRNYHLHKLDLCDEKKIKLIQIFEDEWKNKKQIVKHRLKHIINKTPYKIYARKCEVKIIDKELKSKFLNKYHIQGSSASNVDLGLFYKKRLVSVMTFIKGHISLNNKDKWELSRFASIFSFSVIGGASKLLSYFEKQFNPNEIISYADRRWSSGKLYKQLNFMFDHISKPNYWYLDNTYLKRYHRFNFRKNVLINKLEIFDSKLSEYENMLKNNYNRIWDCGSCVFIKKYSQSDK